ncbi:MAG TPA: pyruvate dehydrogenase (acetyl-transferring) E1 component subunit alpha [Candidatus Acidoferrales bacterium]|nr:pyruvate dehydrogenase (acetyl-transferring) E1 component subunit alpha [Candidatus Acidoferrales bacterium]
MPRKTLQEFRVEWLQILDEHGRCDQELLPPLADHDFRKLYESMVLARTFDDKAFKLQREGRLGTYAPLLGQEAAQVGSAYALEPSDWMFPSYREAAAYFVRGLPLRMLLQYWSGDERGSLIPEGENDFCITIPVGTQIPLATGVAWAVKAKRDPIAVMVFFGDGATSKGDFHEGLNFAGVWSLPIVFVCQNNQWAISVPLAKQTAAKTLAQKAVAYGFEGIQVDGNDVLAVYRAAHEALTRARAGGGPTLIECLTYRMADHTTADDASRYRTEDEVERWRKKDPIERLRKYMEQRKLWNPAYEQEVLARARDAVEAAVKEHEEIPPPDPADMFRYTFAETTRELAAQMERFLSGDGSGRPRPR